MKLFAGNEFPRQGSSMQSKLPISFKSLMEISFFPFFFFFFGWAGVGIGGVRVMVVGFCFHNC